MFTNFRRVCTRESIQNVINYSRILNFCTVCSNHRIIVARTNIRLNQSNLQTYRYKSKGSKTKETNQLGETESEKEQDDDFMDKVHDKHAKILKVDLTSMRMDGIIKAGLGLSRNKIDVIFYESKIRLNGEKVFKKSTHINEGDEIDVIKSVNTNNPNFLTVARVEVLSVMPKEENISVKLRRTKSLTIENYQGKDSWKG